MLEDGERKWVCQRWGAISSNYSAPDNVADGDDDEEYDDDGIINADDNQTQTTKMTIITTLMT